MMSSKENNQVTIVGKVISEFAFNHEVFGEGFYLLNVSVNRFSGQADLVPVMVSERLIDITEEWFGKTVKIAGQFRSYNKHKNGKSHLLLSIFAKEFEITEEKEKNEIFLEGYICKPPVYRKTPLGREITDLLVAVNRPYGKSDYLPCIAWGRNARHAGRFEVGEKIALLGRVQSREYKKETEEAEKEERIAYEVSVVRINVVEEVED